MNKQLCRIRRRSTIWARDCAGFIEWHLRGGKRHFTRYYPEIVRSHKWCFIVGANNSGTSLLQKLLHNTGRVTTLPYEGQLYTRVLKRGMKRGHERVYSEYEKDLTLQSTAPLDQAPRLVFDWMRCLQVPISEIILEKTPHNMLRMQWLSKAFPGSYFICLVRNGYAVAEGIRRKGHQSLQRGARHWNRVNEKMLQEASEIENCLFITYEELVEKAPASAIRLSEFLNIEKRHLDTAYAVGYSSLSAATEESRLIENMNSKSFAALSDADIRIIRQEASTMLGHYGYGPR